jgi:hypothetical protein
MRLHTSGVKVPKLGTLHDRILRDYQVKEADLELSRARFQMLQLLVTPTIANEQARSSWTDQVKEIWDRYMANLLVYELPKESPKDAALKEYYDRVVSKMKPVVTKDKKTGKLLVSGIDPKLL